MIGEASFGTENLFASFFADNLLEIAHDLGIRMGAEDRAEEIVRRSHIGHPIAHGLVDGVFQGSATRIDADHFCSEKSHSENVQALAFHVLGAHINRACEAETSGDGSGRNAMLAGAGFRDDALFPHAYGEKALAESIIYFMSAGMEEIFAL